MGSTRRDILAGATLAGPAILVGPGAAAAAGLSNDPRPLAPSAPPPALAAPSGVAKLTGVDLWYWDTGGDRPAILLLHPNTGSGFVWGYQQAALAAAGYRVIGYSRRGFNGSSSGDPTSPGTAADDLRMLLDHLRIDRAHILGTAAGGFVAASFALMWPQRVRSLTLACTILSGAERTVIDMLSFLREPWYNALPHEFRELSPSYRAIDKAGTQRWHELHEQSRGNNPALNQPAGEPATLAAIARFPMPVLLISADADLISPPPVARLFARTIPGSELVVIPECGHSAYWERPDLFNQALLSFVGRHRDG